MGKKFDCALALFFGDAFRRSGLFGLLPADFAAVAAQWMSPMATLGVDRYKPTNFWILTNNWLLRLIVIGYELSITITGF